MPREVELKSVVRDEASCRRRVEDAGGRMVFHGSLADRRYDTKDRRLSAGDQMLRLRTYAGDSAARATLEWKGPTRVEDGYKVRDEIIANTHDGPALAAILERLGYDVIAEIDRDVVQYELERATVRFERYPRMDALVEVEGMPEDIERAIDTLGLPRSGFSPDRLLAFVARFEARTGERAAVSRRQLSGGTDGGPVDG